MGDAKQGESLTRPSFAVEITFHSPRSDELNTEQLIDQKLQIGKTLLSWRNRQHNGIWSYGTPVTYTLQWATDGARFPIKEKNGTDSTTSQTAAVYSYDSPWALLAFMQTNRFKEGSIAGSTLPDQGTMMFEVKTLLKESEKQGKGPVKMPVEYDSSGLVRSFIRITLRKVGQAGKPPGEQITLPDKFPREMPKFDPYSVWLNSK